MLQIPDDQRKTVVKKQKKQSAAAPVELVSHSDVCAGYEGRGNSLSFLPALPAAACRSSSLGVLNTHRGIKHASLTAWSGGDWKKIKKVIPLLDERLLLRDEPLKEVLVAAGRIRRTRACFIILWREKRPKNEVEEDHFDSFLNPKRLWQLFQLNSSPLFLQWAHRNEEREATGRQSLLLFQPSGCSKYKTKSDEEDQLKKLKISS